MVGGAPLEVGRQARCAGTYIARWEAARLEVKIRRRWGGSRNVRCEVVEGLEATGGPMDHIGGRLPDNRHQNPALRFEVVVDLTPLESGHFGHRGWLTWRVRVDRWLDVRLVNGSLK